MMEKIIAKRDKALERLQYYYLKMDNVWNTRNYNSHIKRNLARVHKLNEIIYKELNVDRKRFAI